MAPSFPSFVARAPWWGPDLQTLRNTLAPRPPDVARHPTQRLRLPLADGSGDALSALLHRPAQLAGAPRPLVVLIHGLAGSEESAYMLASAAHHLERGHPVLRLNLRGAGPSRPHCRLQYHAGRTDDLRDALAALPAPLLADGVLLVGYSLGGNMLLKFLAEHAHAFPVAGAASVSAPIDLAASARRFLEPRNRVYHWHMLRSLKRETLAAGVGVSADEAERVRAARSLVEFDDLFVAPRNGFAGAEDYYAKNAARGFLGDVRVPTLVIHALDDPWIPGECYLAVSWRRHPPLTPLFSERGGHVGFHGRGSATAWHDLAIGLFFADLLARR